MALIVVVEDDPQVRFVVEEALSERGFDVWAVANDVVAYEILARYAARISVMVVDLNLGDNHTGLDVARRALKLNPSINLIYCTGEDTDLGKFKLRGGIVCRKPVPLDVLADMVEALTSGDSGVGSA